MTGSAASEPAGGAESNVLPVVRRPRAGMPGWVIAVGAGFAALLLFLVLDSRRRSAQTAPTAAVRALDETSLPSSPPPLVIPPELVQVPPEPSVVYIEPPREPERPQPSIPPPPMPRMYQPELPSPNPPTFSAPMRTGASGPVLAVDTSTPQAVQSIDAGARPSTAAGGGEGARGGAETTPSRQANNERVRASMLANRATTVPQGTLISGVLETAFDSSRAGFARAIVSRNVMGFDGTRVLIPRGSRVIGEYQSDTSPGQKRALIIWTRLIRDDGATIAIGSPAADPLGRNGVRAQVDSHFFERFSGAILQSALDVGVNLASRSSNSPVILALPGSLREGTGQLAQPQAIQPTLTVKAGTSISIFVARDLDFTDVEARQ